MDIATRLAGEEASTLGRLTIVAARMNPDLTMADELLKKTDSGNLFIVFGEPDIEVRPTGDGQLTVEVCGLDMYRISTTTRRSRASKSWIRSDELRGGSI